MATFKNQLVSVRLQPSIKAAFQVAAYMEMRSLANMFEVMDVSYRLTPGYPLDGVAAQVLSKVVQQRGDQ